MTGITIPNSVTLVGQEAFAFCNKLASVTISSGVASIGQQAFAWCDGITSIVIPSSVTSIGSDAFYHCTALTAIRVDSANPNYQAISGVLFDKSGTTIIRVPAMFAGSYAIPMSVNSIEDNAFSDCTMLSSVTMQSTSPPTLSPFNTFNGVATGFQIHVPTPEAVAAYQAAPGWSTYASKIVTP